MAGEYYNRNRLCGCWFPFKNTTFHSFPERRFLPQVDLKSSTTILATTFRTTLQQIFVNDQDKGLDEVQYMFPLYDGVSVVSFLCTIGAKTIVGVVKEKQQARVEYQAAKARGETAGLLEQMPEASDVFITSIGNVPPHEKIHIEVTYLGELKHDAETDGSRFTIPTIIAPRYGSTSAESAKALPVNADDKGGITISVDVALDDGTIVRGLQSPSHPIAVTMGRTSQMDEDSFSNNHASATLTLGTTELDKDFVIVVLSKGSDSPRALLETHPTIANQRAIMTTLVPKFNIPNISPEIVFVVDRSGSMNGKIELVVSAMKIFLKSLPIGVKFNICSFGSSHSFLFKKSKTYDQSSLNEALEHLNTFSANYGGTEMLEPVKAAVKNRFSDLPLEIMLLTDGEIWNQEQLFTFINQTSNARFFTLGIGNGASSALVEGIARAGNGFAQFVGEHEKMDKRVVRMLKGALTPHIKDYSLEVTYGQDDTSSGDEDFEMIESDGAEKRTSVVTDLKKSEPKKPISLFDTNATEESTNPPTGRYDSLPNIAIPRTLQAPHEVPALYPFNRATVYLLLDPQAARKTPKSVVLRGTSDHGPLELEIPIQDIGIGETVHQLAAKKAVHELEQGRGWISEARDDKEKLFKTAHEGKWDLIVEREAVRLGVLFQVGGKWCSFVAVEESSEQVHQASISSGHPPEYAVQYRRGGGASKLQESLFSSSSPSLDPQPTQGASFFGSATFRALPSRLSHSGSLFGSRSSTSATNPSTGAGLFGSGPVMVESSFLSGAGGSLFGASNTTSPGGGLFASCSNDVSLPTTPANKAGRLFGNAITSNSIFAEGGGLFGATLSSIQSSAKVVEPHSAHELMRAASLPDLSSTFDSCAKIPADLSLAGGGRTSFAARSSLGGAPPRMQMASQASSGTPFGAPAPGAFSVSAFRSGSPQAPPGAMQMQQMQAAPMQMQMQQPTLKRMAMPQVPMMQQMQQMQQMAGPAGPPASAQQLADYQSGLMTLNQQNKARKRMVPQAQPPPSEMYAQCMSNPSDAASADVDTKLDYSNATVNASPRARMSSTMAKFKRSSRSASKNALDISRDRVGTALTVYLAHHEDEVDEEAMDVMEVDIASLSDTDKMHKVIDLQGFDGSWQVSDKLLELLGVSQDELVRLDLGIGSVGENETHKATALAIAWLKGKVPKEEDVWEMVVEKALGWLAQGGDQAVKMAGKYF